MKHHFLNLLTGMSLLLFLGVCAEEIFGFPDDFSIYWAAKGQMISVDSFEDLPHSNAITIRQFSGMPADVPVHFLQCSVEGGNEVPANGVGKSVDIWSDAKHQPVSRRQQGASAVPMQVMVLFQIPLYREIYLIVTAIAPVSCVVVRYRRRCQRRTP